MQRKILIFLSTFFVNLMVINAQNVNFSDRRFKTLLLANDSINTDSNKREISALEALSFKGTIDVSGNKIRSLQGIEAFVNLKKLICSANKLTSLDLSKNSRLEY